MAKKEGRLDLLCKLVTQRDRYKDFPIQLLTGGLFLRRRSILFTSLSSFRILHWRSAPPLLRKEPVRLHFSFWGKSWTGLHANWDFAFDLDRGYQHQQRLVSGKDSHACSSDVISLWGRGFGLDLPPMDGAEKNPDPEGLGSFPWLRREGRPHPALCEHAQAHWHAQWE